MIDDMIIGINSKIGAGLPDCLSQMQLVGLAEPVVRMGIDQVLYPAVVAAAPGAAVARFQDPLLPAGLYHRLLRKMRTGADGTRGYGRSNGTSAKLELRIVCWGSHELVRQERLEALLARATAAPVATNFNRREVFAEEFGDCPFCLPDNLFLFALDHVLNVDGCDDFSNVCFI